MPTLRRQQSANAAGQIQYRKLGFWIDSSSLTTGSYLSLRTTSSNVLFDEVMVGKVKKYYYEGGVRTAMRDGTSVYYLFGDHLGSTNVTTDNGSALVARLLYKPFGQVRYNTNNQKTDYRFTGQWWASGGGATLGLYDYGARWYDPSLARFIQADTIVPQPGNPQALNRYSYVLNNPLRYVDPNGHDWVDALDFLYGFGAQLVLANTLGASPMQEALAAKPNEPTLMTVGRHVGNVAAMVQGVTEVVVGASVDVGGAGLCLTGVGCLAGAPAAVAGTAVAIHGAAVTGAGVVMEGQMLGDLILKARNGSTIKAIDPPSDRGGLRRIMEKAGTKPPGMVNSQAHHNLPWKFREWFAAEGRGLNVNDPRFGRWVEGSPPGQHQNWTRAYEDAWAGWIQRNPNATQQQAIVSGK